MRQLFFTLLILSSIYLYSCSTTNQSSEKTNSTINISDFTTSAENLELKSRIKMEFENYTNSVIADIKVAGNDSVQMNVKGPMSVTIAKLFGNRSNFLLYSPFENSAYSGNIDEDDLKNVLNIPLTFSDFFSFVKCVPPGNINNYFVEKQDKRKDKILFVSANNNFKDYILISRGTNKIDQIQRKAIDGSLIINISYSDYKLVEDDLYYPSLIQVTFPNSTGKMTIENMEVHAPEKFNEPFSFSLPSGMKAQKI